MPTSTTCHDIFNVARIKRAAHSLPSGRYKLSEAEHILNDWHRLITTIAARLHTGGKFGANEHLGPCVAHERGVYLKSIPIRLAEMVLRYNWQIRRDTRGALFEYINGLYNICRKHSTLGWKSPVAFERTAA